MSAQFIDMENTAKNFALQLGSLISLYISIGALINLLLNIITILYPDSAQMPYEYTNATSSIRYTIALLVVFFPTYITLTRLVNNVRRTESGTYLTLTKWLIYLSLLVGGGVILGDFVAVLLSFLNGELTIRFVLKALAVFIITSAAFGYYVLDARGYWHQHERNSIIYGAVVSVLVVIALIIGYMHIETPGQVREKNIDSTQIFDLMTIQSRVQSYVLLNGKLPTTTKDAFLGLEEPLAPEGRAPYTYTVVDTNKFKLCAEFAHATTPGEYPTYSSPLPTEPYFDAMTVKNPDDWNHNEGAWCFERAINPQATLIELKG